MNRRSFQYKINFKQIGIHSLVWLVLFSLNFLVAKNFRFDFKVSYFFWIWVIYILLFYINYLVLMPYFFFKRRFIFYIIFALTILIDAYYVKNRLEIEHMKESMGENFNPRFDSKEDENIFIPKPADSIDLQKQKNNTALFLIDSPLKDMDRFMPFRRRMPWGVNFISLYGLLLIYTASISVRFLQRWQDDEKRKSEIEKEKIETELSFLKQQINPHFLFNSLNSIYSLSISKSEKVTNSILKLSSILRYMLYDSDNKPVSLKEELSIITDYIELQKLRLTEKVALSYKIIGEPDNFKIEPFILIPLIENAFKYGVDSVNDTFIEIVVTITQSKLDLQIKNKIVLRNEKNKQESGIGLKNIKRRLELLYPGDFIFITEEINDSFLVHLEIKHKI